MSLRYAARTDANQAEIVQALEDAGASVQLLHRVAGGCPDLLVGYARMDRTAEIKDGTKPPSARKLTPQQEEWHSGWRGHKPGILYSIADVRPFLTEMEAFALYRSRRNGKCNNRHDVCV